MPQTDMERKASGRIGAVLKPAASHSSVQDILEEQRGSISTSWAGNWRNAMGSSWWWFSSAGTHCFLLGAIIYVVGSVLFLPSFSEEWYAHGVWMFIGGSVLFVVSAACDLLNQAAEGDAIIGAAMGGGISNCSSRQGGNQWTVPRQEQQDQPKQSSNSLELQRDDEERRHAGASDSARPASIRDPQDLLQSTKVMRQPEEEQGDKEPSCCCRCCRVSDPLLMCIVNLLGAAAYLAGSVFYLPTLYASDPSRGPWLFAVGSVLYMAPPALSRLIPRASDDAAFAPAVLSSSIIADSMVFAGAAAFLAACAMDLTGVATGNISGGVAWPLWLFVLGCVAFLVAACANFGLFVPSAWCSTAAAAEAPLCCGGSGSDARAASPSPRRL